MAILLPEFGILIYPDKNQKHMKELNNFRQTPEAKSIESGFEQRENRIELIQDIRDKYGILFICVNPEEAMERLGVGHHEKWFKDALGLPENSKRMKTVRAITEELPATVPEGGVIIGGSIHSVYDEAQKPWISRMEEFIRIMHQRKKPMLGVCFGHQLITQSLGGKVKPNEKGREMGFCNIDLTKEGALDPLFENVPSAFQGAEAHKDIVSELPPMQKAAVLARNDMTSYQALAYGDTTRTVQFHPEITPKIFSAIAGVNQEAFINEGTFKDKEECGEFIAGLKDSPEARKVLRNFDTNFILKYKEKTNE